MKTDPYAGILDTERFVGLVLRKHPSTPGHYYAPTEMGDALFVGLLPGGGPFSDLFRAAADAGVAVRVEPSPWPWAGVLEVARGADRDGSGFYAPLGAGDARLWAGVADGSRVMSPPLSPHAFSWFCQVALKRNLVVVIRTDLPPID